jgi:hypothetical protein
MRARHPAFPSLRQRASAAIISGASLAHAAWQIGHLARTNPPHPACLMPGGHGHRAPHQPEAQRDPAIPRPAPAIPLDQHTRLSRHKPSSDHVGRVGLEPTTGAASLDSDHQAILCQGVDCEPSRAPARASASVSSRMASRDPTAACRCGSRYVARPRAGATVASLHHGRPARRSR